MVNEWSFIHIYNSSSFLKTSIFKNALFTYAFSFIKMEICRNEGKYTNGLMFIRSPCMNNENERNVWKWLIKSLESSFYMIFLFLLRIQLYLFDRIIKHHFNFRFIWIISIWNNFLSIHYLTLSIPTMLYSNLIPFQGKGGWWRKIERKIRLGSRLIER